ncbi:MAG: NusG domain II-containing protein [Clostridia bacterium]|nr:NusG domain II-containing protein [Clostridia bacterium]
MKHKTIILILSSIVLICALITTAAYLKNDGNIATISVDGEVIYKIPINSVSTPYEIPIENGGHSNVVLVENGKISMKSADCPDGLCVKQGSISITAYPIVCLPNKVIIKIEGDIPVNEEPDAISR